MKKLLLLLCVSIIAASCTKEPGKGKEEMSSEFDKAKALVESVPIAKAEDREPIVTEKVIYDKPIVGDWTDPMTGATYTSPRRVITEKEVDMLGNSEDFVMLDSWSQVAWPGCLVKGNVKNGYQPVSIPLFKERQPFRLNINVVNGDADVSNQTELIDFRSVPGSGSGLATTALNNMVAQFTKNNLPAKVSFSISSIQSYEELAWKLRVNSSFGKMVDIKSEFGTLKTTTHNYFLVNLTQTFFEVSFDGSGFESVFNETITPKQLEHWLDKGASPLAYVASVNYGRRYVLLIETSGNAVKSNLALNAAFSYGKFAASTDLTMEQKEILSNMSAKVVMLGGGMIEEGLSGALQDMEKLTTYLTKGAVFGVNNPAAPIGLVIKDVANNETISSVCTSKYKVQEVSMIPRTRDNTMSIHFSDWACGWWKDGRHGKKEKLESCSAKIKEIKVSLEDKKTLAISKDYVIKPLRSLQHAREGAINNKLLFNVGPDDGSMPDKNIIINVKFDVASTPRGVGSTKWQSETVELKYIYNETENKWEIITSSAGDYLPVPFFTIGSQKRAEGTGVAWKFCLNMNVIAEGRVYTDLDGKIIQKK